MKKTHTALLAIIALTSLYSCKGRGGSEGDAAYADSLAKEDSIMRAKLELEKEAATEPVVELFTSMGRIRVRLYADTPKHRDNFVKLARESMYDGVLFHRVIDGFIIQTGDPYTKDTSLVDKWGQGGTGYTIPAEFTGHTHKKGAIAAARQGDLANPKKASNGAQFYIVQNEEACKHLDGNYTVFGETLEGMEVIDRIAKVQTDMYDKPMRDIKLNRVRVMRPEDRRDFLRKIGALDSLARQKGDSLSTQKGDSLSTKEGDGLSMQEIDSLAQREEQIGQPVSLPTKRKKKGGKEND